jgi:sterol desaturase/sphingolipid hydroxylase (fatty acid hydroxylase superfamily)
MWWQFIVPIVVMSIFGGVILVWERVRPGRALPEAPGWYKRALIFNGLDIVILSSVGLLFDDFFRANSLFRISEMPLIPQTAILLVVWSFVFYWWHRAAHMNGLWHIFHQMHHSPSRIEMATTFYKHPVEAIWETFLTSSIVYLALGASPMAGAWLGAAISMIGFVSHGNIRTPKWVGWFIQRPEQHSIHHQFDVHAYNYADFILWDRLFGTFKEAEVFAERCGFHGNNEARIGEILRFKDVYK